LTIILPNACFNFEAFTYILSALVTLSNITCSVVCSLSAVVNKYIMHMYYATKWPRPFSVWHQNWPVC